MTVPSAPPFRVADFSLASFGRKTQLKRAARDAAIRAGLGRYVNTYLQHRMSPMQARDKRDMEHMSLLLRFWLHADSSCVDVGANAGLVLREIAAIAPSGDHHAFEP